MDNYFTEKDILKIFDFIAKQFEIVDRYDVVFHATNLINFTGAYEVFDVVENKVIYSHPSKKECENYVNVLSKKQVKRNIKTKEFLV